MKAIDVKEIKIRYKIDTHDYQVRINSIKKFISQGNKVKIVEAITIQDQLLI